MPEVAYLAIRLGFLAVLWLFVLAVVRAIRADLFGSGRTRAVAPRETAPRTRRARRGDRGPASRPATMLVVTAGSLAGTVLRLGTAPVTIGRAPGLTLVIDDDYASSHHARLVSRSGEWLVEDLGSTNGTYLDRERVAVPTPVPLGVPVRIGKTALELRP